MNSDYDVTSTGRSNIPKQQGQKRERAKKTLADKSVSKSTSPVKKHRGAEDVAQDVLASIDSEATETKKSKSMRGRVSPQTKPMERKRTREQELSVEEVYDSLKKVQPTTEDVPKLIDKVRDLVAEHQKHLVSPLDKMKEILDRFDQLERADIETQSLTPAVQLRLAVYIEETIPRVIQSAEDIFVEKSESVPRALHFTKEGSVFLMADPENSKLHKSGTFKRVFSAMLVPFERIKELAKAVQARIAITEPADVTMNKNEIAFFKMVQNQPGFVQMHAYFQIGKDEMSEFRVLFEHYDGTLTKLTKRELPFDQKLDIARQFLEAMAFFHANNALHLDIKMDNVLFKEDPSGKITIGITDFGHSLLKDPHKPADLSRHILSDGEYGSRFATAPELIGNTKIKDKGDALEKIDAWGAGMFLGELFYGDLPWTGRLNRDETLTPDLQVPVRNLVEQHVEFPLKILLSKRRPTQDDLVKIAILQLLRLDPKDRSTVSQALNAINQALRTGRK